eukprot:6556223-Prymnesium_polylepis.1
MSAHASHMRMHRVRAASTTARNTDIHTFFKVNARGKPHLENWLFPRRAGSLVASSNAQSTARGGRARQSARQPASREFDSARPHSRSRGRRPGRRAS